MKLKHEAAVITADGRDVGRVDRVVLDPKTDEVTHIVVRKGWLFTEDKVVPIDMLARSSEDRVTLRAAAGDLQALPDFHETHYLPADRMEPGGAPGAHLHYARPYYWYPPFGSAGLSGYVGPSTYAYPTVTETNLPAGTVALRDGARVLDRDGEHVGDVEQVLTDPQADRATHLVISRGLLLKTRKLVPTDWLRDLEADTVRLAVDKDLLGQLPEYHLERASSR